MAELDTQTLPVLPLPNGVVLPGSVVTLALDGPEAKAAVAAALGGDSLVLLVPNIDGRYARVGVVAMVEQAGELPNGITGVVLRGMHRALVGAGVNGSDGLRVQADPIPDPTEASPRAQELSRELRGVLTVLGERRRSRRLPELLRTVNEPGALADGFGSWSDLPADKKVQLLETTDVEERVQRAITWARDMLAEHELNERIRTEVADGMESTQREFLLRRQLDAIRKELGETGDDEDAVENYRTKIAASHMPDDVRAAAIREVDKLERTSEQSPEHGWIRTWLDWMTDLPWGVRTDERDDVVEARSILDADHTGLEEPKDRIVEYLAVRALKQRRDESRKATDESGPTEGDTPEAGEEPVADVKQPYERGNGVILALVGPPGVGKTSLGESIARALHRNFVRVSLGGVRDEAEIRGHRRTYVGALPGRIVRAIKESGSMNPVVLLDEVDKMGADYRGDPSSALLEVLDPAQNQTFRDHYLEVDLDLSDVLFLATANVADTIPGPLLDRMEVVRLDGYTEEEKVAIARDHLWARQVERNGLEPADVSADDVTLRKVVTEYTREAGVRGLERTLGKLLRKFAAEVAKGTVVPPVALGVDDVRTYLGRPRFFDEPAERTSVPGVATGLAVTGVGGDVLFVEATSMEGEAGLTLTGQVGDVMKESAQIALSFVRSHAAELGLDPVEIAKKRFHVHVPAGAIPKDGPSAGVTLTTALVSLLTGRPVRSDVAMTGEVTLQGKVLPIGGLKQKVLAAERMGITTVIFPKRNEPDLDDVPEAVRERMTFHALADVREVLEIALAPAPAGAGAVEPEVAAA
ncbi:MAG: endopeptidase La [Actinomycetia bacterium]|nr:endopeptidase La [Actinomycetes bacterium]